MRHVTSLQITQSGVTKPPPVAVTWSGSERQQPCFYNRLVLFAAVRDDGPIADSQEI